MTTNPTDSPPGAGPRSLLGQLFEQVTELGRLYVSAGRQEVEAGINDIKIALIFFGVTVMFLAVAVVLVILLIVSTIAAITGLPLWATALIVLFVVLVLAALFGWLGYRRVVDVRLMPEKTIEAAKEDLEWAQHWTKRG
ncbi:MAG TPA: phage holin family protein [Candidatus Limnocylindria bacterium]|nr:phage holin family protein [Candidatus Limnocylindria bacterium]